MELELNKKNYKNIKILIILCIFNLTLILLFPIKTLVYSLTLLGSMLVFVLFKFQMQLEKVRVETNSRIANLEMECYSKESFLMKLANVGSELISEQEYGALIKKIRDGFASVTKSSLGYLLMFNQNKNVFEWGIGHNLSNLKLKTTDITSDDPLIRLIVSDNEIILFHDISELLSNNMLHIRSDFINKLEYKPEVLMTIRLKMKQSLLGVQFLFLTKMQSYDLQINLKIFKGLVNMSTLALGSAVQREFAINDRMTMMYNHEYFISRLREEIAACKRATDRKLSILMIDIDHFKKFNDTYGHQIGDFVLIETSKIYKECVRMSDVVSRYGGEEFAIIFPQTALKDAVAIAEKIRSAVENHSYKTEKGDLKVTISIGVSELLPDQANNINDEKLVKMADDKLYEAKDGGRNQVRY